MEMLRVGKLPGWGWVLLDPHVSRSVIWFSLGKLPSRNYQSKGVQQNRRNAMICRRKKLLEKYRVEVIMK
jgi:hypothetical protein